MKKKRVSKRNKISWRKFVNIDDVEEFLDDQRSKEKLGVTSFDEISSFIKDSEDNVDFLSNKSNVEFLSKKEKIKLRLANPRCFQILKPHTKVPDPLVKRNKVKPKAARVSKLVQLKENDRKAKGILKAREIDSIKGKQLYEKIKLQQPKRGEFNTDVWEVTKEKSIGEWVEGDAQIHNLRETGGYLYKVTPTLQKKTSVLPNIEPPHPGTSYNPSFEDHQDLLRQVADKEQELIKRDEHLNRVTKSILKKVSRDTVEKSWLQEMSQGLPIATSDDPKDEKDEVASDSEYKAINPPVQNKKKTRKQRNTQKRLMLEERLRQLAKIEKRKIVQLNSLKSLGKYVEKRENDISKNKEKREEYEKLQEKETKRLGFHKFEENDLDFNMPTEITGSLRGLQKQSNLLVDRFNNMQKRNLMAPSVRIQAKKGKIKRFIKPGFKDDWKKNIAGLSS